MKCWGIRLVFENGLSALPSPDCSASPKRPQKEAPFGQRTYQAKSNRYGIHFLWPGRCFVKLCFFLHANQPHVRQVPSRDTSLEVLCLFPYSRKLRSFEIDNVSTHKQTYINRIADI